MAHKTLIGGTAYEISGGKTLIDSTVYEIKNGKALVGGTVHEIGFKEFTPWFDLGTFDALTESWLTEMFTATKDINAPTFDISKWNAILINGEVYEGECYYYEGNDIQGNLSTLNYRIGVEMNPETAPFPFFVKFTYFISSDKWQVTFGAQENGIYNVSGGIYA